MPEIPITPDQRASLDSARETARAAIKAGTAPQSENHAPAQPGRVRRFFQSAFKGRQTNPEHPIIGEKPTSIEQDLADSLADGIEVEQSVPLNETQKRSLREKLGSALNFKVPLTGKIARDLLIEGGAGAIAGVAVKNAAKTGLFALGSASSLGVAVGIGAAGGAATAVAKEIIRIKKESVKEDYQKRMAEIREKHQGTRNAFKRELAVRWEAGQIQRVTLAGLRGGATGAVGGLIGFELADVAWGNVPVVGDVLAKAREVTSGIQNPLAGISLIPKPPTPPAGELTWDSEGSLIQPVANIPNGPQLSEPPTVTAPTETSNIPPAMHGEGNWNLGHISTDQAIPQSSAVPDVPTHGPQPSLVQPGESPGSGEPFKPSSFPQTDSPPADNSGTGVGPRKEDIYRPAVPDATQPGEVSGLDKPSGSLVAPAPATAVPTPVGETIYEPAAPPSAPPVSTTEFAVAGGIIPKDGIIPLPEGSNPWNVAKDIGDKALGRPLSDSEVLKLTKALSMDSKIGVDDWKISGEGFTHHRFLPPGFKLNFGGPNVVQALNEMIK